MSRDEVTIVYDGDCPFCSDFVALQRLQKRGYKVHLIDARDSDNELVEKLSADYNLDDGMIVVLNGCVFHGASAARFIASSYANSNVRALIYRLVLKTERIAGLCYPFLVLLRKGYFRIAGKKLINESRK